MPQTSHSCCVLPRQGEASADAGHDVEGEPETVEPEPGTSEAGPEADADDEPADAKEKYIVGSVAVNTKCTRVRKETERMSK